MRMCYESYLSRFEGAVPEWICETAADAVQILDDLQPEQPDLILSDLTLPDAHEVDVVKQLRTHAPGVPILVVSGQDDDSYVEAAFAAGADGYVLKGDAREVVLGVKALRNGETFRSSGIQA